MPKLTDLGVGNRRSRALPWMDAGKDPRNVQENSVETDLSPVESAVETDLSPVESTVETDLSPVESAVESAVETDLSPVETDLSPVESAVESNIRQVESTVESTVESAVESTVESTVESAVESVRKNSFHREVVKRFNPHTLTQLESAILLLLYNECYKQMSRTTPPIKAKAIAAQLDLNISSTRKSIQRMEKKSWLIRDSVYYGNTGGTSYRLSDELWVHFSTETQLRQPKSTVESAVESAVESTAPREDLHSYPETRKQNVFKSSSSSTEDQSGLSKEWLAIDYSVLNDLGIPFSHKDLKKIWATGVEPEAVQQSIFHFAYDLRTGYRPSPEGFKNKLAYFIGCFTGPKALGMYHSDRFVDWKRWSKEQAECSGLLEDNGIKDELNDLTPEQIELRSYYEEFKQTNFRYPQGKRELQQFIESHKKNSNKEIPF